VCFYCLALLQCPCGECQSPVYDQRCLSLPNKCPSSAATPELPSNLDDGTATALRGFLSKMNRVASPSPDEFCFDGPLAAQARSCCAVVRGPHACVSCHRKMRFFTHWVLLDGTFARIRTSLICPDHLRLSAVFLVQNKAVAVDPTCAAGHRVLFLVTKQRSHKITT